MSTKTVLIVSSDEPLVRQLCREHESLGLHAVVSADAACDETLLSYTSPNLICIDASKMRESDLPLLIGPFAREACRHRIPLIVLVRRDQHVVFDLPDEVCVYRLAKGPRLLAAWTAVLRELLDVQPQDQPAPDCH